MAYNATASSDNLICTEYVNFGKCQDRFGRFFWSKNDSNYLDVKLKVFKEDDKKEFRLAQNLTMGEADFKQLMRLRNQLVDAVEKIAREENLSADTYNVQRHGWTTQTGSQGSWRSVSGKQKDFCDSTAVQCGQAWEMLNSYFLQGRRMTRTFSKLPMSIVNLNLSVYLM